MSAGLSSTSLSERNHVMSDDTTRTGQEVGEFHFADSFGDAVKVVERGSYPLSRDGVHVTSTAASYDDCVTVCIPLSDTVALRDYLNTVIEQQGGTK